MSVGKDPIAAELGRRGGRKGGRARALSLTPEQRREIAQRAAAARWQRGAGAESAPQAVLANTPVVTARGALHLADKMLDGFVLADGRKVLGLLSAAAALDDTVDRLSQRVADATGGNAITFHVPGDWRLMRGIEPTAFVAVCRALAEAAIGGRGEPDARRCGLRAVGILSAVTSQGLGSMIDAAVRPLGGKAPPA
jgi:hypothetical protein